MSSAGGGSSGDAPVAPAQSVSAALYRDATFLPCRDSTQGLSRQCSFRHWRGGISSQPLWEVPKPTAAQSAAFYRILPQLPEDAATGTRGHALRALLQTWRRARRVNSHVVGARRCQQVWHRPLSSQDIREYHRRLKDDHVAGKQALGRQLIFEVLQAKGNYSSAFFEHVKQVNSSKYRRPQSSSLFVPCRQPTQCTLSLSQLPASRHAGRPSAGRGKRVGQHAAPARENTSEWVQAEEARDKYGDDLEAMVEFGTLEARESTMLPKGSGKLEYKVRDSGGPISDMSGGLGGSPRGCVGQCAPGC